MANSINTRFEAAWESVRPVPIVTIDFGNGQTVTRTLHGNIATYLCSAEGQILDVLPGLYEPTEYAKQLDQFALLHRYTLGREGETRLLEYHLIQAELLKSGSKIGQLQLDPMAGVSKRIIENPVKFIVANKPLPPPVSQLAQTPKPLGEWPELYEDTRQNESHRREAIHRKLASIVLVKPSVLTKWVYREVLKVDLDDPQLGLGDVLKQNYPFAAEDQQTQRN